MHQSFAWTVVDPEGSRIHGRSVASSRSSLRRQLEAGGHLVVAISEYRVGSHTRVERRARKYVLAFTQALSPLLGAGVPLARALTLAGAGLPPNITTAVSTVRTTIENGSTFADALNQHPEYFDRLYISMVRAGERNGLLPDALGRLADHLERQSAIRSRLVTASIYPIILGIAGCGTIVLLFAFVLPRLVDMLAAAGAPVPQTTQALIDIVGYVRSHAFGLALLAVGTVVAARRFSRSNKGKRWLSELLLIMPIIGPLRRSVLGARFARLLAILTSGGAALYRALGEIVDSFTDTVVSDDVAQIRAAVRQGSTLHRAIERSRVIPPLVAQLVRIGEDAGTLSASSDRAADILEQEVERALQRFATLVEPALIVIFGLTTGFIALSLLQAIYGINTIGIR